MSESRLVDALLGRLENMARAAYWAGYQDGLLVGAVGVLALVLVAWLIGGRR